MVGGADNELKTDLREAKSKIEIKGLDLENEIEVIINPAHVHSKMKFTAAGGWEDQTKLPGIDAKYYRRRWTVWK